MPVPFLNSAYPASVLWMGCAPCVAAHYFGLEGREEHLGVDNHHVILCTRLVCKQNQRKLWLLISLTPLVLSFIKDRLLGHNIVTPSSVLVLVVTPGTATLCLACVPGYSGQTTNCSGTVPVGLEKFNPPLLKLKDGTWTRFSS